MSKRPTSQEATLQRLLALLNLSALPQDAWHEAVRKALLSAYLEGYAKGLQDNLSGQGTGPGPGGKERTL